MSFGPKLPLSTCMMRRALHVTASSPRRRAEFFLEVRNGILYLSATQAWVDPQGREKLVAGRFTATAEQLREMTDWMQDQAAHLAELEEREAVAAEREELAELEAEAV